MNRWQFLLRRLGRKLWVRASLYALLGVMTAIAATLATGIVPEDFATRFGGDSVVSVLTILASSMLAVATFSLGAMVTAYTSVSQQATPRVAELITGDATTQKSLSTFVGAFLYAIVGVTAINAGYYGAEGRAVVFVITLVIVGLVAFRLLAWVSRLSSLARVGHMIERVEGLTREAMAQRIGDRHHPSGPLDGPSFIIASEQTGYVQNVDRDHLQGIAETADVMIEVVAGPGKLVRRGDTLIRTSGGIEDLEGVRAAFAIGPTRSFEQDPRYGLVVLGEIAGKALSPGVNDPGTAVQVIVTGLRLMEEWDRDPAGARVVHDRLLVQPIEEADLLDDLFGSSARYGAGDFVVATRLQTVLRSLGDLPGRVGPAARDYARDARSRSMKALAEGADRKRFSTAFR
ncbi:DUF2254 domain-containing protein [Brevundimonas basaltis]|uniref:Putative membrane protein n=1 Tax=Brevundimonas basaltis TaxID=472166 RepID=A0A7W8HZN2_9CAUL|nr:DUF2254 domain-containing protein [Brevundimonas basaltis]MBB5292803.1 putative membrane protein [Brevundimonas basaltis]